MKRCSVFILLILLIFGCSVMATNITDSLRAQLESAKSDSERVYWLNDLSWAFKDINLETAKDYNEQSIKLCNQSNVKSLQADVLNTKASIFSREGNYSSTIKYQIKALEIAKNNADSNKIATLYNNIGSTYRKLKEDEKARKYYYDAITIFENLKDTSGLAMSYGQLGSTYLNIDNDKAVELHKKSLYLKKKLNDPLKVAIGMMNLANALVLQGNYPEVESTYIELIEVFKGIGDKKGEAIAYSNWSEILFKKGEYDESIYYSKKALGLAQEISFSDFIIHCHNQLSVSYEEIRDYRLSLFHFKKASLIKDSIFNSEKSIQIAELETRYQTKQKEQQIALLAEKNKVQELQLSQKNRMLWIVGVTILSLVIIIILIGLNQRNKSKKKESDFARKKAELKQQALRAQMNPHFLFNSLNSIQRIYVEGNMMLANDYMADFSNLLRNILNNSDKEKISLKEDLEVLELYMTMEKVRTDGQINYYIEVDKDINLIETYIAPMKIQPFVENAIWHGILPSKKKGNITLKLHQQDMHFIMCTVEDDGVGIFTSRKERNQSHVSKGMALTKERLGDLGDIKEEEISDGGTRITITIPIL